MIPLGKTSRYLRDSLGLTQREMADKLSISIVHLSNIENNKSVPSRELLESYSQIWGVDLYVLAWCQFGDLDSLPDSIRRSAHELAQAWKDRMQGVLERKDALR